MTDFFEDMYFTDTVVGHVVKCRRCDREGVVFGTRIDGISLAGLTDIVQNHIASHAAVDARRDVKDKAPLSGDIEAVVSEIKTEVTEFVEHIAKDYGPRLQKALTEFGLKNFLK